MALPDRPGGLRLTYEVPLSELDGLAKLLLRGREWARQQGITLSPTLAARVMDIDQTAGDVARGAIAALGTGAGTTTCTASGFGSPPEGQLGTLSGVVPLGEVAVRLGLSTRRVRSLAGMSELRGRRTSAGWIFDVEEVERFMAKRSK